MRAIGATFSCVARASDITTRAAAPSLTGGALTAVTVPSFLNAGVNAASAAPQAEQADFRVLDRVGQQPVMFCIHDAQRCEVRRLPLHVEQ